jgi:hypothetical protein
LEILADPAQIAVAIQALCTNALEALGHGGHLTVSLAAATSATGKAGTRITVSDDGPGIRPEIRDHIFDPYFSGREAGRGLGFGLCKCWRIVTDHGGNLEVTSGPTGGASFTIDLPVPAASAAILSD